MNCIICDKETGSDKKRTCCGSCRAKASRMNNKTDIKTQAHAHAVYERDVLRTRTDLKAHAGEAHGMTETPEGPRPEVPENYGQDDCKCRHCKQSKAKRQAGKMTLNHGPLKAVLADNEYNRVSLPGDVDYEGVVCDECKAVV